MTQCENELCWGLGWFGGEGVVGGGIMADANATLVAGNDMGYVGSGGGRVWGSLYARLS